MKTLKKMAAAFAVALAVMSCEKTELGSSSAKEEQLQRANEQFVDAVVVPTYRSLADECLKLQATLESLTETTTEALVDAPSTPVHIYRTVVVTEGLTVEGDGVLHESIRNQNRLAFAEHVFPRSSRGVAHAKMELARLAIQVVIFAVGFVLHHVRSPNPVAVRPVHRHECPVFEVLAAPKLGRTEASAATIGSGIYIIGVAKLFNRWVGEIAW